MTGGAFTLIELLIVAAITAIIALAIFSVFAGGINIYRRVSEYKTAQQDLLISFEKMERDLRNALDYSKIDFVGDRNKVSFAAMVDAYDRDKGRHRTPGRVSYYIDTVKRALIREEESYAAAASEKAFTGKGDARELMPAEEMSSRYLYYDKEAKKCDWKESWNLEKEEKEKDGKFPIGVEIGLTYKNDGKENKLTRTVFMPLAQQR